MRRWIDHQLTPYHVKDILLSLYKEYTDLKRINSRTSTDNMLEGLKALSLYTKILDYYYKNEDKSIVLTEDDILELYEKIKQVYYLIKTTYHVG
jgi:hypothetical protein